MLVGEYMGWNFAVGKGGAYAALLACWFAGILYTCVAMIDSEVTSTVAAAGGQYTQAKHIVGPLMAFNVGLYLVFAYTMLEAANAITAGYLVSEVARLTGYATELDQRPFIVLVIMFLAWLNYRGVLATLTFNLVITAIAFLAIVILFLATSGAVGTSQMHHAELMAGQAALPYGWIGVLAAVHFGLWFYLGIEGTTQAAEEVRSPARALPFGTLAGIMTLLIAATLTWYICVGLIPWEFLGDGVNGSVAPLFDAARLSGSQPLVWLLGLGTLFATLASANGCINDASRAWFAMGRDKISAGVVRRGASALPHTLPLDRLPRADRARLRAQGAARPGGHILDPVGPARIHLHAAQHHPLPAQVADGRHQARLRAPVPSGPGIRAALPLRRGFFRRVPRLRHPARGDDHLLYCRLALVPLLALSLRQPGGAVHHALAEARGLLSGRSPPALWSAGRFQTRDTMARWLLLPVAIALALSFIATTRRLWREAAQGRADRAAYLSPLLPLLADPRMRLEPSGFPRLAGRYVGHTVDCSGGA